MIMYPLTLIRMPSRRLAKTLQTRRAIRKFVESIFKPAIPNTLPVIPNRPLTIPIVIVGMFARVLDA